MFLHFFFMCFVAKFLAAANSISVDRSDHSSSLLHPSQDEQLKKLIEKIEELEKKQESFMKEIGLLRETTQKIESLQLKRTRMRRNALDHEGMAQLPTEGCTPGTYGCPVSVTPFSVGGSCILCPASPRGYPGPAGPPGRDGRDAIAVITASGSLNSVGIEAPCREDVTPASNSSGAVYIRWGHHSCPSTSTLIYSGTAAAPSHLLSGNGADQLCLPPDPIYDETVAGIGVARAFLHGLEYQIDTFPSRNDRYMYDVPCAVCKAPSRFAKLMIPGKNECPSNEWTLEYGGYLMAERSHSAHHRSLHICVDREMEILHRTNGGPTNNHRAYINLVETVCSVSGGGVPCGPYINGYEVTCALCTM